MTEAEERGLRQQNEYLEAALALSRNDVATLCGKLNEARSKLRQIKEVASG